MTNPFPKHLVSVDGLEAKQIETLLDHGQSFVNYNASKDPRCTRHKGKTVVNVFFENSTRTVASFEIAAKRLGADALTLPMATSSVRKGETVLDTILNIDAMNPSAIVIRHNEEGIAKSLTSQVNAAIINGGDGTNEHPTQALLDALTMRQRFGRLEGLKVAICGDIKHSRVAGSNFHLLTTMGADIRAVAPAHLAPKQHELPEGVKLYDSLEQGIEDCNVVMMLRLQKERISETSDQNLSQDFCLTMDKLEKHAPEAVVMHPGPMNRDVEICSNLLKNLGERNLILNQTSNGVAMRMAILDLLLTSK